MFRAHPSCAFTVRGSRARSRRPATTRREMASDVKIKARQFARHLATLAMSRSEVSDFARGVVLGASTALALVEVIHRIERRGWGGGVTKLLAKIMGASIASSAREDARGEKESMIARLGLIPHPEGGFFVETYRTGCAPMTSRGKTAFDRETKREDGCATSRRTDDEDRGTRNHMTSIYYMLTRESDHQWWALNESDHVHYHHAGGAVTYHLARSDGTYERRVLGRDVEAGQTPQLVVKGGTFKAAVLEPGTEYAIIGEAVSPGFDFRDFRFVTAGELAVRNAACFDDSSHLIKPAPEDTFDHYYTGATPPQHHFTPERAEES